MRHLHCQGMTSVMPQRTKMSPALAAEVMISLNS
jgi:hypothetical protein